MSLKPLSLFLITPVVLLLPPAPPVPNSLAVRASDTFLVRLRLATFLAIAVREASTLNLVTETFRASLFSKKSTIRSTAFASLLATTLLVPFVDMVKSST